jgi:hypothetical protein
LSNVAPPISSPPRTRHVGDHGRADRDRPVGQLIPRQQVSGEARTQDCDEQEEADHPVELPGTVESPGEVHTQQVEDGDKDQEVGTPVVDVAHELTEPDLGLQAQHRAMSARWNGFVHEHQEDAREQKQGEQHERHPAQTPGVGELHRALRQTHGSSVEDQMVEVDPLPLALRLRMEGGAEDGAPDARG